MLLRERPLAFRAAIAAKAIAVFAEALAPYGAAIANHGRDGLCFVRHGQRIQQALAVCQAVYESAPAWGLLSGGPRIRTLCCINRVSNPSTVALQVEENELFMVVYRGRLWVPTMVGMNLYGRFSRNRAFLCF